MPLKNWCSIHARWSKSSLKHSIGFCGIFPKFKTILLHIDCIFENHQLWQSGFSRVYSNCCCSCSFEPEIIKTDQSSHKMYSNNIVNFQESTTILNACTKKSGNLLNAPCIISECSKLASWDYMTRYNGGGGWKCSTGNCARKANLTILLNGTCANQNPFRRVRRLKFSGILRYQEITSSQSEFVVIKKKEKKKEKGDLPNCGLHRHDIQRKQKESQVPVSCQRTKKSSRAWRWQWYQL